MCDYHDDCRFPANYTCRVGGERFCYAAVVECDMRVRRDDSVKCGMEHAPCQNCEETFNTDTSYATMCCRCEEPICPGCVGGARRCEVRKRGRSGYPCAAVWFNDVAICDPCHEDGATTCEECEELYACAGCGALPRDGRLPSRTRRGVLLCRKCKS